MILCVIGTRPEAIKMAPVILALKAAGQQFKLISTGQHRELVDDALKYFKLKPDVNLRLMRSGQHPLEFMSRAISKLYKLFDKEKPDVVLAQGDTTTVMATATVCFNMAIRFGHVEAGLRTHDLGQPWPEEWNRRIASIGATYHFAPTDQSVQNLLAERVQGTIHMTGNTVVDALQYILRTCAVPKDLPGMPERNCVLITCHRRENFGQPMYNAFTAIADYAKAHKDIKFVYPVHPNPTVKNYAEALFGTIDNIQLIKPLAYGEFIRALSECRLVISDSGGVQEEAPSLGKRVIVLRDVTERPEGVEAGFCYLAGTNREKIQHALDGLLLMDPLPNVISPYGDGRAASRIVKILMG